MKELSARRACRLSTYVLLAVTVVCLAPSGLTAQIANTFVPITPCRVVDTRASFNFLSPFGAPSLVGGGFTTSGGPTRTFPIPMSTCGIPSNASAYSFNVTVIPAGSLGFLTIFPTGQPRPNAVTVDDTQGLILNNAAIVPAGTNGSVDVYASQNTDLVIDINGYFVPSGPGSSIFVAIPPCRVVDTRASSNFLSPFGAPTLVGGGFTTSGGPTRTFPIPMSNCGIPLNSSAYSFNVTVIPPGPLGFLTIFPTGKPRPNAVTVDDTQGLILNNAAIVPAGMSGSVDVFASQNTDLVIDINGYYVPPGPSSLVFVAIPPCRVVDTRASSNFPSSFGAPTLVGGGFNTSGGPTRTFPIPMSTMCSIPSTAQAYSLNVTVIPPGSLGFLTIFPTGQTRPDVVTVDDTQGLILNNAAIVPAGTNGSVDVFASQNTDLAIDINGYFVPLLAPNSTVGVTISDLQDTSLGNQGSLPMVMSTSFNPSNSDAGFFQSSANGSLLTGLSPHHLRFRAAAPQDFSEFDVALASILNAGDHSPELQLNPPASMTDGNGRLLPANFQNFTNFAVQMVQHTDPGSFAYPVQWFGILNEPDAAKMPVTDYVNVYNSVVSAMKAAHGNVKIVAGELSYWSSDPYGPAHKFVSAFVNGATAQPDAFAFHYYPVGCDPMTHHVAAMTDQAVLNDIFAMPGRIASLSSVLRAGGGSVPVWVTENNISSVWDDNGVDSCSESQTFAQDPRATSAFFAAWRPLLFSQLGKAGAQALHHWDVVADAQFGEIGQAGNMFLSYWVDKWLSNYFSQQLAPGPMILKTSTHPDAAPVEALAVENGDRSVNIMLANFGVADGLDNNGTGVPLTVSLNLSALGTFSSATSITIDTRTNPASGPMTVSLPSPVQTLQTVSLSGYGVTFLHLQR